MKREELIAMGISEEDADKIMADYGSSIQREKAKTAQYKEKAEKADELQKKIDDNDATLFYRSELSNLRARMDPSWYD